MKICCYCKKNYLSTKSIGRGMKFCSRKCWIKSRFGHKHSQKTIEKLKIVAKKRMKTVQGKKQFEMMYKRSFLHTHTPEALKKMVETRRKNNSYTGWCKGQKRPEISGKRHFNWQGGISKEPYPFEWTEILKKNIRQRDNYICQICGITEEEHLIVYGDALAIHHIDYNKKNLHFKNLISLCHPCHYRTNYNRSYWIEYFKNEDINKSKHIKEIYRNYA